MARDTLLFVIDLLKFTGLMKSNFLKVNLIYKKILMIIRRKNVN